MQHTIQGKPLDFIISAPQVPPLQGFARMSTLIQTTFPTAASRSQQPAVWRRAAMALWSGFQAMGLSHARGELMRQARLREGTDPELARQLREAAQRTV